MLAPWESITQASHQEDAQGSSVVHFIVVRLVVGDRVRVRSLLGVWKKSSESGIALVPFLFCKTFLIWNIYTSTLFKYFIQAYLLIEVYLELCSKISSLVSYLV